MASRFVTLTYDPDARRTEVDEDRFPPLWCDEPDGMDGVTRSGVLYASIGWDVRIRRVARRAAR